MEERYVKALKRDDLTEWLIHLTKGANDMEAFEILKNIILDKQVNASSFYSIIQFEPEGAVCFHEIPLGNLEQLLHTNPSNRRCFGIIVYKRNLWYLGGRPVIYTDNVDLNWPVSEKYRLVNTKLNDISPIDWSHEREWRKKGHFELIKDWWFPCVESKHFASELFLNFNNIDAVYIRTENCTFDRNFNPISRSV